MRRDRFAGRNSSHALRKQGAWGMALHLVDLYVALRADLPNRAMARPDLSDTMMPGKESRAHTLPAADVHHASRRASHITTGIS